MSTTKATSAFDGQPVSKSTLREAIELGVRTIRPTSVSMTNSAAESIAHVIFVTATSECGVVASYYDWEGVLARSIGVCHIIPDSSLGHMIGLVTSDIIAHGPDCLPGGRLVPLKERIFREYHHAFGAPFVNLFSMVFNSLSELVSRNIIKREISTALPDEPVAPPPPTVLSIRSDTLLTTEKVSKIIDYVLTLIPATGPLNYGLEMQERIAKNVFDTVIAATNTDIKLNANKKEDLFAHTLYYFLVTKGEDKQVLDSILVRLLESQTQLMMCEITDDALLDNHIPQGDVLLNRITDYYVTVFGEMFVYLFDRLFTELTARVAVSILLNETLGSLANMNPRVSLAIDFKVGTSRPVMEQPPERKPIMSMYECTSIMMETTLGTGAELIDEGVEKTTHQQAPDTKSDIAPDVCVAFDCVHVIVAKYYARHNLQSMSAKHQGQLAGCVNGLTITNTQSHSTSTEFTAAEITESLATTFNNSEFSADSVFVRLLHAYSCRILKTIATIEYDGFLTSSSVAIYNTVMHSFCEAFTKEFVTLYSILFDELCSTIQSKYKDARARYEITSGRAGAIK